jgi:preprotein translocase subunit SecA
MLAGLDMFWMNHLENMEALREAVRLRAYGQHEPIVEYRREGHQMFQQLLADYDTWLKENEEKLTKLAEEVQRAEAAGKAVHAHSAPLTRAQDAVPGGGVKVGRNDPCPCGAINPHTNRAYKYKQCGLIGAPHHKQ